MSETEEEGGLLPAALAGAGILLFAALLIFGTGDDATETTAKGSNQAQNANAKRGRTGAAGGVGARTVDSAERSTPIPAMPQPPKSRINPEVKRLMVTGEMKDPPPVPPGPPVFETPDEERDWVQRQLDGAKRLLGNRKRALDKFPRLEEDARKSPDPDAALDALALKKELLEKAIVDNEAKVAEYEAKLAELG